MTETQHTETLEEEVVSNDPTTDQEPAPDQPYGKLPQYTEGVNPWRVNPEATQAEGKNRGFVLPRMATPAGVIAHFMDWASVGHAGSLRLLGENPLSFAFVNLSSLGVYGFNTGQARVPGSHHWVVPPYSCLVLGTKGPISWIFDPSGTQAKAPSQKQIAETYIVQAYDILLAPILTSLATPTD